MDNREYWRNRAEQDQEKLLKPLDDLAKRKLQLYNQALRDIQKNISYYVEKFSDNNGIFNYYEASKLLNSNELEEFKMGIDEYIKLSKDKGLSEIFSKELENASLKARYTRLQALEQEILNRINLLYYETDEELKQEIQKLITENQNRLAYNISTKYGNLINTELFSNNAIENMIKTAWAVDEVNFSDRLWQNKNKLVNTLNRYLTSAIIRGEVNSSKTFKFFEKTLNADYNAVRKIILTESAYFSEKAKQETYKNLGCKQYEVVGTLDSRTCETCGGHDGEVWEQEDYKVGVTAPIYHPYCRCTTAPYVDLDDDEGLRWAKDKDGNKILVPADMTYEEFKEKYLQNSSESDIIYKKIDTAEELNEFFDKQEYKFINGLTDDEKEAVKVYTSEIGFDINNYLREDANTNYFAEKIEYLDSTLDKFGDIEPMTVYRRVDSTYVKDLKVGEVYTDKAFISTSPLKYVAEEFAKDNGDIEPTIMVLDIKGNVGAYINKLSEFAYKEYELLLKRDLEFIVTEIIEDDGYKYIKGVIKDG